MADDDVSGTRFSNLSIGPGRENSVMTVRASAGTPAIAKGFEPRGTGPNKVSRNGGSERIIANAGGVSAYDVVVDNR